MGYLTTFTIYNDGCDLVKKHPEKFAEEPIDTFIKVILVIMAFYGAIVGLEHYGYIIKPLK